MRPFKRQGMVKLDSTFSYIDGEGVTEGRVENGGASCCKVKNFHIPTKTQNFNELNRQNRKQNLKKLGFSKRKGDR